MVKYRVWLGDNYTSKQPLTIPWDKDLIGENLRIEFAEYFNKEKERNKIVSGGSKQLLEGEVLKQFMVRKQINLVDDPATKSLKSVFVLKVGEVKVIDERAWQSLKRYARVKVETSDGSESSELGFLEHEKVGKSPEESRKLEIKGEDVSYFAEKEVEKVPAKMYKCDYKECGKEFGTEKQLRMHKMHHVRAEKKEAEEKKAKIKK